MPSGTCSSRTDELANVEWKQGVATHVWSCHLVARLPSIARPACSHHTARVPPGLLAPLIGIAEPFSE
eukprot:738812-Prymnesium_polylepis.1